METKLKQGTVITATHEGGFFWKIDDTVIFTDTPENGIQTYNNEGNSYVKKCAFAAINSKLIPIICVGETLKNRENGSALEFISKQIENSLPNSFENIIIAYEPIWSIGTGKIPSKIEIKEMHKYIKDMIFTKYNKNIKVYYWRKDYWNLLFKSPKRPIETLYLKEGQKNKLLDKINSI